MILSQVEKEIARKIVTAFKQTVCGFDILRVQGRSYCCDVNGFSFVKNSRKYYDDASQILVEIMITAVRPELHLVLSTRAPLLRPVARPSKAIMIPTSKGTDDSFIPLAAINTRRNSTDDLNAFTNMTRKPSPAIFQGISDEMAIDQNNGRNSPAPSMTSTLEIDTEKEELRCVIGVIRHGDRTPKQKMKVLITESRYLDYFHQYSSSPKKDLKVKSRAALVKFLETTREILADPKTKEDKEFYKKLIQVRDVFERWEIRYVHVYMLTYVYVSVCVCIKCIYVYVVYVYIC